MPIAKLNTLGFCSLGTQNQSCGETKGLPKSEKVKVHPREKNKKIDPCLNSSPVSRTGGGVNNSN